MITITEISLKINSLLANIEKMRDGMDKIISMDSDYLNFQKKVREQNMVLLFYPNTLEFGYYNEHSRLKTQQTPIQLAL